MKPKMLYSASAFFMSPITTNGGIVRLLSKIFKTTTSIEDHEGWSSVGMDRAFCGFRWSASDMVSIESVGATRHNAMRIDLCRREHRFFNS